MDLEALLEPPQDRDRVLLRGFRDQDRLKTSLQGRILLDVFSVFVECGGPDTVQFATGEHGLQKIARVHGPLCLAGPHDGVDLIDEQEDPTFAGLDLLQHRLEAFLELAPVLCPGNQCAEIELVDRLVLQAFRHVPANDPLGKALRDRGLADARLADQDRVVLRAPGEDSDHPPDLRVSPDDRVELAFLGQLDEVPSIQLQGLVGAFRCRARNPLFSPDFGQGLEESIFGEAEFPEQLARGGLGPLLEEGKQDVFCTDILVFQPLGLFLGPHEHLIQSGGYVDASRLDARAADLGHLLEAILQSLYKARHRDFHLLEESWEEPLRKVEQCHEQVLGIDLLMLVLDGDILCF